MSMFERQIEEGYAYVIKNFLVGSTDPNFKTTRHGHKLTFMRITKCTQVKADNIPKNYFEFLPFPKIIAGSSEGFPFGNKFFSFVNFHL